MRLEKVGVSLMPIRPVQLDHSPHHYDTSEFSKVSIECLTALPFAPPELRGGQISSSRKLRPSNTRHLGLTLARGPLTVGGSRVPVGPYKHRLGGSIPPPSTLILA